MLISTSVLINKKFGPTYSETSILIERLKLFWRGTLHESESNINLYPQKSQVADRFR